MSSSDDSDGVDDVPLMLRLQKRLQGSVMPPSGCKPSAPTAAYSDLSSGGGGSCAADLPLYAARKLHSEAIHGSGEELQNATKHSVRPVNHEFDIEEDVTFIGEPANHVCEEDGDLPDPISVKAVRKPAFLQRDSASVGSVASGYSSTTTISTDNSQGSLTSAGSNSQGVVGEKRPKQKRTAEEIARAKAEAQEKKQRRAQEKEEKQREKEEQAARKRVLTEAQRMLRPGDCLRYVTASIDPRLLEIEGAGADILSMLQASQMKYKISEQVIPASVTWTREVLPPDATHLDEIVEKEEAEVLVNIELGDFVDMVHAFKQSQEGTGLGAATTLSDRVAEWRSLLPGRRLSLLVLGVDKYFRNLKTLQQRQHRERVLNAAAGAGDPSAGAKRKRRDKLGNISTIVDRMQVEECLVDLQLTHDVVVKMVEAGEVAELVAAVHKAVAEAPHKREKARGVFLFCDDNSTSGGEPPGEAAAGRGAGLRVAADGRGLAAVWRAQLQQFKNISAPVAAAIAAHYASPRALMLAYDKCESEQERKSLLADIVIRRGAGVLESTRRVGIEHSRRIYKFFCAEDPAQKID